MNLRNVVILVFATCLCGSVPFVQGQGTDLGTIRGIVSDASGSVVPDAAFTVTDTETGAARLTKTNGDGEYEVFGLRPGSYKIVLNRAGFAAQEIENVVVKGSSVVGVNATLRVSSAEEKIEVTVGVPEINTEKPTISNTINSRAIIDLPRDSRDIYNFLYLNPNITQADVPGDFKFIGFQSYGASFSAMASAPTAGSLAMPRPANLRLKPSTNSTYFPITSAPITPGSPISA